LDASKIKEMRIDIRAVWILHVACQIGRSSKLKTGKVGHHLRTGLVCHVPLAWPRRLGEISSSRFCGGDASQGADVNIMTAKNERIIATA